MPNKAKKGGAKDFGSILWVIIHDSNLVIEFLEIAVLDPNLL